MNMDSNAPLPPPFIPDEIIAEILCLLPVKTIVQLRCVSKAWKTLISDPTFVQKHLNYSSQNPYLLFTPYYKMYLMSRVKFFPVRGFLEAEIVSNDNFHGWMDHCQVVGTCNGLVCLFSRYNYGKYWFRLWNPATGTLSKKLRTFQEQETLYDFTFGCDISTGTYKLVSLSMVEVWRKSGISKRNKFRVFTFGDNYWRKFQCGSSIPVCMIYVEPNRINNGVHLNGTVNWLALPKYIKQTYEYDWEGETIANAQQFVIVSLDLSTETCTQFLLPPDFDELPIYQPNLNVLMDCLCFSHDLKESEFVIWQMKEFGVENSWTLLFKINYIDIKTRSPLVPLYLSKNGDTLILGNYDYHEAVTYKEREKIVKRIRIPYELYWFSTMDYVESLVSPLFEVSVTPTPNTSLVWKYGRNFQGGVLLRKP